MVFRKPYAFLIKNFKKIHLLLLVLWGFICYKMYVIKGFVSDFITFGTYNKNLEGISTKTGFLLYFSIVLIIILSLAIIILLLYKKKPWKIYIYIIVSYIIMIYGLISVTSYFDNYTITSNISEVLLSRDILRIARILQYGSLIIILIRITGLDIKKFQFNTDSEFLELSSKDREEFEVSFDIDKNSFKRLYKKLKRNIGYVYQEHKFIINLIFTIIVVISVGYSYYYFGVKHKNYKQGNVYSVGVYDITIKKVYITNKDTIGNIIEKDNKFVVVIVNIKNKSSEKIEPNFSRFHLMNQNINRINTIYYDDSFKDFGKVISNNTALNAGEDKDFVLVYKVPKKLKNKRFVMYYQEYNGHNDTYLRKIKLKYEDVSKIKEKKEYSLGEDIEFKLLDKTSTEITFDTIEILDAINYNRYTCTGYSCDIKTYSQTAEKDKKILKILFASSDYEGKEFIDFTSRYGIIKYVDNENKEHTENIKKIIDSDYEGNELYFSISNEVATAKEIYIDYKVRNVEYIVKIK